MKRAGAVLFVALLGGCGEDARTDEDASSTPGTETIDAADWSKRTEQLCEEHATRAERALLRLRNEARKENLSSAEFAARALEMAARGSDPMLDRLEALPPPEGHEEQARRSVAHSKDPAAAEGFRPGAEGG